METTSQTESSGTTEEAVPTPQEALEQTNPKSLDELFKTDPELLTKEDIGAIVARLREARMQFAKAEAAGKKPAALTPSGKQLTLEDLNL